MFGWFRNRRRRKLLAEPWPESWSLHLNRNIRLTWKLSPEEMKLLQDRVKIFHAEKHWTGCQGLKLTEEITVTIAGQACLMLLGVNDYYFDNVKSVLVYPQAFERKTTEGMIANVPQRRAGEAWQGGPIVLSWKDALRGGRNEDDGQNVVIHEFAHALDGIDGEMGGSVVFDSPELETRWQAVLEKEFHVLCEAKEKRQRTLLDHYGASNRAEFFAVATETFFEQPIRISQEHPELFELLSKYYHLDPRPWVQH